MNVFIKDTKLQIDKVMLMCKMISPGGREISLAITDAQRAHNWLGRYQLKIGDERTFDQYKDSLSEFQLITDRTLALAHIINEMQVILDNITDYIDMGGSSETPLFVAINCLTDSLMWLETAASLSVASAPSTPEVAAPTVGKPEEKPQAAAPATTGTGTQNASMEFPEALHQCINGNKKIGRKTWNIGLTHVYAHRFVVNKIETPFLLRKLPNGGDVPWQPDQIDLFAKDWVVLN